MNRVLPPSRNQRILQRLPDWVIKIWDTPLHWLYVTKPTGQLSTWLHHHNDFLYESCLTLEVRQAEEYIRKETQ